MTAALLIVDVQNAYFEDPSLAAEQSRIVAQCNRLSRAARECGANVVLICTEHERDKSTWTLSMLDDDQGYLFRGTEQTAFLEGLETADFARLVKTRDSAFFGTDLLLRLRNWNVDTVILAGAATQNCVAQTAADAFANNLRVVFAEEAMGSNDEEAASALLPVISEQYRQPVLSVDDALLILDGSKTVLDFSGTS